MRGPPLTDYPFHSAPESGNVETWLNQRCGNPSAPGGTTSPRRAGHRRLGGTATEARRKGRGTESGVGGLLMTLDLGATRYRDFQRNVRGGS